MSVYDSFADSFAVHAEHSAYNAHYDCPAVLGLLGDVDGRRVLDVGCGSGLYAAELAQRGADVVGSDNSAKLVQHARRRAGSGADLRVHDVRDPLDWLGDESVDRAIMALGCFTISTTRSRHSASSIEYSSRRDAWWFHGSSGRRLAAGWR